MLGKAMVRYGGAMAKGRLVFSTNGLDYDYLMFNLNECKEN